MAMKACKECKKEISTDARQCPNCGKKNPTQGTSALSALFAVGILFLMVKAMVGGATQNSSSGFSAASQPAAVAPASHGPPEITVDNKTLWKKYEANEVSADAMYKGRRLSVDGVVASIDKNAFDSIIVRLVGPNPYMNTMATLEKSETTKAGGLSKGDKITMFCTGKGRVIGMPSLDDCTIQ